MKRKVEVFKKHLHWLVLKTMPLVVFGERHCALYRNVYLSLVELFCRETIYILKTRLISVHVMEGNMKVQKFYISCDRKRGRGDHWRLESH